MNTKDIIRTWKVEEYRLNLSDEDQAILPGHTAGIIELRDTDPEGLPGGATYHFWTFGCCKPIPIDGSYRVLTIGCCPL